MREQGIDIEPRILVVTRLIPEAPRHDLRPAAGSAIAGTDHAAILRVPVPRRAGRVVPHWISRFEIWPYLERFAPRSRRRS